MEKERKIEAPEGCEIEKVELVDGVAVVTFKQKERKLPKSWDEFCEMFPVKTGESRIMTDGVIQHSTCSVSRNIDSINILPDRETAEAVLALGQLIQLRNAYNGDWVPNWKDDNGEIKHVIEFYRNEISETAFRICPSSILYFKTEELRDEFLRNFRDLIEKIKPLYGIKEGGEK